MSAPFATSLKMAEAAIAPDVCRHRLADHSAAGTAFPSRSGAGVRCEATRDEVCLTRGSTACRARRAVRRTSQDAYRRDPGLRSPAHSEDDGSN